MIDKKEIINIFYFPLGLNISFFDFLNRLRIQEKERGEVCLWVVQTFLH